MMIARRCCCSAISVLFQTTRPRSVLVSQHKQKNSSLLSSIDRSHFFFVFFFERFFFVSKPRRLCCKSRSFLQFFSRETSSKNGSFCVFATKKEKFSSANLSTWSPLLFAAATHPKSAEIGACLWHKISVLSSPLHKIKTLLKGVLFNTRTRTAS